MSAYESAKGFTSPIIPSSTTKKVPEDIRIAQKELIAKRKLKPDAALKDNPRIRTYLSGDIVQVYIKGGNCKARMLVRAETSTALRSTIWNCNIG